METKGMFDYVASYLFDYYLDDHKKNKLYNLCEINDDMLYENIKNNFKNTILRGVSESLIYLYHSMKNDGKLSGKNKDERMIEFGNKISNYRFINGFLSEYTNLDMLLRKTINDLFEETLEILTNFANDYNKLNLLFDKDIGKIKSIDFSQGDLHSGRSVSIVNTTKLKLVYKPRNALNEQMLEELYLLSLKFLKRNINFRYPLYFNGKDYLWQEYVEYDTCKSIEEVKDFYYKCGIYLAIFYVLGSSDLHYENLVACGEHPMFIDLETLINGSFNTNSAQQRYRDMNSSVLHTAMLPIIDNSSTFDINMSALFTGNNISKTMYGTVLIEDEENDWVFKSVPYQVQSTSNIVTLNGKVVGVNYVIEDLIQGFRDTLTSMVNNKASFMNIFKDEVYSSMKIRQLLRPTRVYSKFLSASQNPEALKSIELYESIFDILLDNFKVGKYGYLRVEKEIELLKMGYIPSFHAYYNDSSLYCQNDLICENYFCESPQSSIINKLSSLDASLIDYQTRLIKFSLATTFDEKSIFKKIHIPHNNMYWNKKELIDKIDSYLVHYLDNLIEVNNDEATMQVLSIQKDKIQIKLMSSGLYDDGGTILLLALYGKKYNPRIENISKKFLESLISQYRFNKLTKNERVNFSVFSGQGGLIYLTYNFYKIFKNNYYLDFFEEIIADCFESVIEDSDTYNIDYLEGMSGIVYLLTQIYLDNKNIILNEKLSLLIHRYINYISSNISNFKTVGLAHGISGIILTLLNIYRIHSSEEIIELCYKLLNIENLLIEQNKDNCPMTWCNGIIGMVHTRCKMMEYLNNDICKNDIVMNVFNNAIKHKGIESIVDVNNYCLCHGIYGNIEILKNNNLINKEIQNSDIFVKKYFEDFNQIKWLKIDVEFDSFMLGTPGVIYSLLGIYDLLPSVMGLEIYED